MLGILFAQGRRTVSGWLRAAGVDDNFNNNHYSIAAVGRKCYFHRFSTAVGRKTEILANRPLVLLARLPVGTRLLVGLDDTPTQRYIDPHHGRYCAGSVFGLDDTPTQRYGPKVQGAVHTGDEDGIPAAMRQRHAVRAPSSVLRVLRA
jgi:hypothetical protein